MRTARAQAQTDRQVQINRSCFRLPDQLQRCGITAASVFHSSLRFDAGSKDVMVSQQCHHLKGLYTGFQRGFLDAETK